jgi:O-antigen ligase
MVQPASVVPQASRFGRGDSLLERQNKASPTGRVNHKPGPSAMKKIGINGVFIFFLLLFVGAMPFSIAVTQNALFLSLLLWIWISVKEKKKPFSRTPFDWFFVAYLAVEIVSMSFSSNRAEALVNLVKRMLLVPIVYLMAGSVQTRKRMGWLLMSLTGVMVVVSLIGIIQYNLGPGGLEGRLKLFHHYMTSGGILMIIGLMTFAFVFVRAPFRVRIAALLGGLVIFLPLYYTYTRSSWLGFLAGFAFMILYTRWKWVFALVPALVLLFLLAPPPLQNRLASVFNPWHPNNIERTYMWKAGMRMIYDRPLTGYGDIDLGALYKQYKPAEATELSGHLHNNFVMLGATLGIPGLLAVLGLFIRIFIFEWKALRSAPRDEWLLQGAALGCAAAFIGFQINGLFEWNFGDSEIAMLLWLTVGLVLAVDRIRTYRP